MEQHWNFERLKGLIDTRLGDRKFIVVSNREPFVHERQLDGAIECMRPASGMITALHPIMIASGGTWIAHGSGSADRESVDGEDCVLVPPENPSYRLKRVWLDPDVEKGFYHGLANEGLWPLCHVTFTRPEFRPKDWEYYRLANQAFADAVIREAGGETAFVFIQDYHFCLLPRMLRERSGGKIICAHFWHIPWPNREVFRAFPWGEELLYGMLGNDLMAFHIHYHCQNFLETVDRTIEAKVDTDRREITRKGHTTRVRPFPISIDFEANSYLADSTTVKVAIQNWRRRLPDINGKKVVASIERLDYSKGIPQRLSAIEYFLEENPEWHEKVSFIQIAVPSRDDLASYQAEQTAVDEAVDRINKRFGNYGWLPIHLLKEHHHSVDMIALHRIADVFMVNSLHDGMNLVAKEYLASRNDRKGVLILSHFTGAARELSQALRVNPYSIEEISTAIRKALKMSPKTQKKRMALLRDQVAYQNIYRWAGRLLMSMLKIDPTDEDEEND